MRPHRRQPTRPPSPWDSPGKNTGVGCHFLIQCMKVKSESEATQLCPTVSDPMDCSLPGSSVHGIFQVRVLEWGAITSLPNTWLNSPLKSQLILFSKKQSRDCHQEDGWQGTLCIETFFYPMLKIDSIPHSLVVPARQKLSDKSICSGHISRGRNFPTHSGGEV